MRPVVLTANTPRSFYRGTGRIHRFRGLPAPADEYHPEDWIASTTARFGSAPLGLTTLPDGQVAAMLSATNRVPVRPGDAVLVPAGLPHAIGPGIFLVEAQEPTDFSVLLEREGFPVPESAAFLELDRDLALSCVDRRAWSP